jgi:hypothetical protein
VALHAAISGRRTDSKVTSRARRGLIGGSLSDFNALSRLARHVRALVVASIVARARRVPRRSPRSDRFPWDDRVTGRRNAERPSNEHPAGGRTAERRSRHADRASRAVARPWDARPAGARVTERRPPRQARAPRDVTRPRSDRPTGARSDERPSNERPTGGGHIERPSNERPPGEGHTERPWDERPTGPPNAERGSSAGERPSDERPTGDRHTERPRDEAPPGNRISPAHARENPRTRLQSPAPSLVVTRYWKKRGVTFANRESVVLDCIVSRPPTS